MVALRGLLPFDRLRDRKNGCPSMVAALRRLRPFDKLRDRKAVALQRLLSLSKHRDRPSTGSGTVRRLKHRDRVWYGFRIQQ